MNGSIEYQKGIRLWQYPEGVVVTDVPIDDHAFWHVWHRPRVPSWVEHTRQLANGHNGKKFPPIFYCKRCRRHEDGAHRLMASRLLGLSKIDVRIGGSCFEAHRRNEGYLHQFEALLNDTIRCDSEARYKRELDWVQVCERKKWFRFRGLVDFKDASVLDVGCQVGYSCFEAWRAGATHALGVDKRHGMVGVAQRLKAILDISDREIEFRTQSWEQLNIDGRQFDVVFCMGLLHYFKKPAYGLMLAKLAKHCKGALILEFRLRDGEKPELLECGDQTLPTAGYLRKALNELGFNVRNAFVQRPNERGLWLAEREN